MPSSKESQEHKINNTKPSKFLSLASSSPPNKNDKFFTPAPSPMPTPSVSRNSFLNNLVPIPSISCKSGVSFQSFHTAIAGYDDGEEPQPATTTLETINEKQPLKISSTSQDKANDYYYHMPTPTATSSTGNLLIHPISLVQSNSSIPSNFFYYGSLDSGSLSKSPAGSYFHDYFSEDYEVVLDDGTRQKRSVSLSTLPQLDFGKKKYKANFNHSYFDEQYPQSRYRQSSSRSQTEEFYHHLLEEEERKALTRPNSSLDPNAIIQDLQPSESSDEDEAPHRRGKYRPKKQSNCLLINLMCLYKWLACHIFTLSHKQKMVLKCSFAYLLGSLFTFIPFLNNMLRTAKLSSHVIATVTVFFNPSKTVGGMIEAISYGLIYTICALVLSLLSMVIALALRSEGYYVVSCCVTLGFWLAGSTFVLSYIKAKYNKPAIATGCGLGFMIIFPVLVKEGSVIPSDFDATYIEEMSAIVFIGSAVSACICWFVWPMTATKKLKSDINDTLMAIKILLKLLTKTFLLDTDLPEFTANESLQNAINSHRTSFTSLQSSLHDAKNEFYNFHIWKHADEYDDIVSSLQRLAQHIGGLRSSCGLQFDVMKTTGKNGKKKNYGSISTETDTTTTSKRKKKVYHVKPNEQRKKMENELRKEENAFSSYSIAGRDSTDYDEIRNDTVKSPVKQTERQAINGYYYIEQDEDSQQDEGALVQFIKTVRPPMKSLAYTCKQTIVHLQSHFTGQITDKTPSFSLLRQNLAMAMSLFEESQQLALTRMYRRKMKNSNINKILSGEIKPQELQSHLMNEFPAQDVFLVYFFVFCLLEFAKELMVLVECVQSVYEYDEEQKNKKGFWAFLKYHLCQPFWFLCCCFYRQSSSNHKEEEKSTKTKSIYRKRSTESFVPNNNNTFNTLHTPKPKTKIRKFFLKMWGFFLTFRQHSVRYAIKSALIALAIASMAFIPATRDYFLDLKMDWTLITVMAVMTPTVGGTNQVAVLRVLATILGSVIATLFYLFLPTSGNILLFATWAFSIPCFWMILNHKHGRFGMFSLLSYNLIVPYMYNHRNEEQTIDVIELAYMRCATVSAGVIIGLIVTAYIWPYEARREMRKGLSDFLIRLSWLYKQLVSEYSDEGSYLSQKPNYNANGDTATNNSSYTHLVKKAISEGHKKSPPLPYEYNEDERRLVTTREELEALARRNEARLLQFQHIELSLQVSLVELQQLLAYAPNEPRLKGPFPTKTYEAMLTSCQNILDKFLSIRIVIMKDVWATQVRRDLMLPASQELMDMAGSVLLYFYLLASALQLKTPLPPTLPPAEKARELLMLKLQQLPKITANLRKNDEDSVHNESIKDECYMVYYAYVVIMESIIIELDILGQKMKELFGSLIPEDQWKKCFGLLDLEASNHQ